MPSGALVLLILRVLRSGPLHGYAIAQRIHVLSSDALRVEEGSLYPALQKILLGGRLQQARRGVQSRYDAYFADAIWLANQSAADVDRASRDSLVRATCSVRLLKSDVED